MISAVSNNNYCAKNKMLMKNSPNFGAMTVKTISKNFPELDIAPVKVPTSKENLFIKNLTSKTKELIHMKSGKRHSTGEMVHSFKNEEGSTFYHVSTAPNSSKVTKLEIDDVSTDEKIKATRDDKGDQPSLLDKMGKTFMKLPKAIEKN